MSAAPEGRSEHRGRLLLDGRWCAGRFSVERGRFTRVERLEAGAEAEQARRGPLIAAGLIDLHVHGFGGCEPIGDLAGMAAALARAGTTAFQPTLFPAEPSRLGELAARVWASAEQLPAGGARALGLHLEGPFVNRLAAGALPIEDLAEPSTAALAALLGPHSGAGRGIRTLTLAPELAGAGELVAELARCGIRASLGHSLATAAEARAAARRGACGATHLFNAMRPLHHREVGLAGFALCEELLQAELIGDLVHVSAEAVALALNARGPLGLCLVSDALQGAGTGCAHFEAHGRRHEERGGAFYYPGEPPKLAGSATGQWEQVRRLVQGGATSLEEALQMASEAPARALGLERECGRLAPGARADWIEIDEPRLALAAVWVGGRRAL